MNELMKIRMEEMEKRIKEQSENFIKFSEVANQKEAQLYNSNTVRIDNKHKTQKNTKILKNTSKKTPV